jgi:hypothetical protein
VCALVDGGVVEAVTQCLDKYATQQEVLAHACGLLCMLAVGGVHRTAPVPPIFTPARRWSAACAVPAVLASLQVRDSLAQCSSSVHGDSHMHVSGAEALA